MFYLHQCLLNTDIGLMQIIAEQWGIELDCRDVQSCAQDLASQMLDKEVISEIVDALSEHGMLALLKLINNDHKFPWAQLVDQFGAIREIGPGKRDRERPDRQPISPLEELLYRGLIYRGFLDTPDGAIEHAYIPSDVGDLISSYILPEEFQEHNTDVPALGHPAAPKEHSYVQLASDGLLDRVTTFLAAKRSELNWSEEFDGIGVEITDSFLLSLCQSIHLIDDDNIVIAERVKDHLTIDRGKAFGELANTWMTSANIDEMRTLPQFRCMGGWRNDPYKTRNRILDLFPKIPPGTWWSLNAFVQSIRDNHPDIQRRAGEYDSWYIQDTSTGEFLKGIERWLDVEGKLIKYLIRGPFHLFGLVDLGSQSEDEIATSFKRSNWAETVLNPSVNIKLRNEDDRILVNSKGEFLLSQLVPRHVRYQISRFCEWNPMKAGKYVYSIEASSLRRAQEQGLTADHLLYFLKRYSKAVPPKLVSTIERWFEHGSEASLETATVLRVGTKAIIESLLNSKAERFLADRLGDTAIVVNFGAEEKVKEALRELGYLSDSELIIS